MFVFSSKSKAFSKRFSWTVSGFVFFASLLLALDIKGAHAIKFIYESFIPSLIDKVELGGDLEGGQFGSAIASGDVDGDGVEDLIVSSPFASVNEKEWNGSVKIIFGYSGRQSRQVSTEYYGEGSGDQLGTSLAVGDFNNDKVDDIAIGAHNAQDSGIRPGKVYIIYGGEDLNSQVSTRLSIADANQAYAGPTNEFIGKDSGDQFGVSLFAMDVNNDGVDDLAVGAPFAWGPDYYKSGAVYVYFGAKDGLTSNPDYSLYAKSPNEKFGAVLNGGHIVSRETNDLVIGAYFADRDGTNQSGKVYIYRYNAGSSPENFSKITLSGELEKGWFGFSMDVANLNNDEYDDLAVSTFPYKGDHSAAKVSIFYGNKKINRSSPDVVIKNPESGAFLGASVLLEDLDGDKRVDIVLGAPNLARVKNYEEGRAYVIYNHEGFQPEYSFNGYGFDAVIHGEIADDWFGADMDTLDFNSDGKLDLAIGARYSDVAGSINNGKVFIIWGDGQSPGNLKAIVNQDEQKVSRGELVKIILDRLNIRKEKADYIQNCYDFRDFCLFNFMAMTGYKDVKMEPEVILYPDVQPGSAYYGDVNIATMLGLVNGYLEEEGSPFHPDAPVTRIQALKVVLGAADLVPPKYQFELAAMLGSHENLLAQITSFVDVDARISSMWWYPRYINFAVENNIVDRGDVFRPNDNITVEELDNLINRTIEYLNTVNKNAGP